MLQIVAERVREARTDGFEPGCLAALLRMEGCGVRVAARSAADDAGRLELRVFDDIIVTVSASPNGRALRVTTPTGNPPRGNRGRPKRLLEVGGTRPRSVRFPDGIWKQIEKTARARGLTVHAALREAILGWLRSAA